MFFSHFISLELIAVALLGSLVYCCETSVYSCEMKINIMGEHTFANFSWAAMEMPQDRDAFLFLSFENGV